MAVFTTLDKEDINKLIEPYGIGELVDYRGISEGMENTNYFLTTSSNHLSEVSAPDEQGHYVLTIFEELPESHLPFHLKLLDTLKDNNIPAAYTLRDYNGNAVQYITTKPAIIATRLPGEHIDIANTSQCQAIGECLANIHLAAANMEEHWEGTRDIQWLSNCVNEVSPGLGEQDKDTVNTLLKEYKGLKKTNLPTGIIHGDLFRDNALFSGNTLSGVIDFYNAGDSWLLYDLAIVVNDWCITNNSIDNSLYQVLIDAYNNKRPFTDEEKHYWPLLLKVAAMRFWLSRLLTRELNSNEKHELLELKDPEEFRQLLIYYIDQGTPSL